MPNRVLKNISWLVLCKIAQSFVALIIGMISARYLGPSNYGLISYASSVVAFVVPIVQLGLRSTIVEELVSHSDREGEIMGTALVMTVTSSFFGILSVIAFTSIANAGERETIIVCALHSIGLLFQMTEMIQYWYQAKLLSKYMSITSLGAYIVVSAYKVFLLMNQKSIYWFSVSTALDYMIISVVLLMLYRKLGTQKLSFSSPLVRALFSKSKYYILSGMMVTLFSQTDRIMIKMMINDAANGYYAVAVTCAGMTSFVFQAIIDSFRPLIFSCKKTSQLSFEKNMSRLYAVILYMGLLQSVFLTAFADIVISIIYGEKYLAAIPVLRIITWYSSFAYMGSVRNIWILAEGQQKYLWMINLSGALLNVGANFILIPVMGASGAAVASVTTQFFANCILCFMIRPIRPTAKLMLKGLNPRTLLDMIPKKR